MEQKEKSTNYFIRHWRGDLSLPVSYWINGFLANIVAYFCVFLIAGTAKFTSGDYSYLVYWLSVIPIITLIVIWQTVGIWRSSDRYSREESRWFWPAVAKLMVIFGVLNLAGEYNKTYIPALRESFQMAEWVSSIEWEIKVLNEGKEVELSGGIKGGISEEFLTVLKAVNSIEVVHVNLYEGGMVDEAMQLNKIIHEYELSTYVSGECVSACTIVYLGGKKRFLNKHARLGFHTYSVPGVKDEEMNLYESKSFLRKLGIGNNFINRIFNTPSDEMWYPTADELVKANVVHRVVDGNEFAMPDSPSTGISELNRKIDNLANVNSIEESISAVKAYNDGARAGLNKLRKRAKSQASIDFVKLTERQNILASEGENYLKKFGEIEEFFETANFETTDELELEKIEEEYLNFCEISSEYIEILSDIMQLLEEKIELLKRPEVIEELTPGQGQIAITTLNNLRDSQVEILIGEKKAFKDNLCDQ